MDKKQDVLHAKILVDTYYNHSRYHFLCKSCMWRNTARSPFILISQEVSFSSAGMWKKQFHKKEKP